MWQDHSWDDDVARRYDTPGTGMFAPEVLEPTVERLAQLAGDGAALELAFGAAATETSGSHASVHRLADSPGAP